MGYINKGGSGGGGGGFLPDYSLSPIIYPRKWVNGNDVYEISVNDVLNSFATNSYFLINKTPAETCAIVEHSFAYTTNGLSWNEFGSWKVFSSGINALLFINNPFPQQILVTGVIKYVLIEMPVLTS
ncbi:MAG: hypothetical protein RMJ97_07040 [Raineya sp.]|nr:hypothetical protein [Raineya sp.]MDW8296625.1 hypothetical protein [Raineya sp.]